MSERLESRTVQMAEQRRIAPIQSVRQDSSRTVSVMWSSGYRRMKFDWAEGEIVMEELDMSAEAVDLTRLNSGAPVLNTHNRSTLEAVLGVVEKAWLDDGKGFADLRFSHRDDVEPFWQDIKNGIIRNVSIGYHIEQMREAGRDPKTGYRILRATRWVPFEISMLPVGAEPGAGTRSDEQPVNDCVVSFTRAEEAAETRDRASSQPADSAIHRRASMKTEVELAAEREAAEKQKQEQERAAREKAEREAQEKLQNRSALELEQGRRRAIENLAKANKIPDNIRDAWVGQGYNLEQVSNDILKILEDRGKANPQPASRLGLSQGEVQRFSFARAIAAMVDGNWVNAGFEAECTRALAQKLGRVVDGKTLLVPFEVLQRPADPFRGSQRDLTVATAGAGGYLVETENVGFIEILRNRSVAFRMGARRLSGLQGSVTIPRQSAAATAVWLANEASTATESQQTFVQVALTPKTVSAYTEISRQLLLQSSPGAEGIVTDDLAQVVAIAADLAVLEGSGAGGQPTGISATAGIGSVTGTSLAAAGVIEFQTDVAASNVMPMRGGYVTTPAVAGLLMTRPELPTTGTERLWKGNIWDGRLFDFPSMTSNQLTAASMIFGDWQEVVVGEWGVLELMVNPFANFQAGIIGVRALYSLDVGVRRPFAFSRATTIT